MSGVSWDFSWFLTFTDQADYLLFVDGAPVGVVEAKKEGDTLTGVELQTTKYSEGVPDNLPTPRRPLPFQYQLDDDFKYGPDELDRGVVAKDQIRMIIQTFRDRLFTEIFPGRTEVPKTLIFAKDDSHADDIVQIVREEFGK